MDSRDLDLQNLTFISDDKGNRIQRATSARYTNLARVIVIPASGAKEDVHWEVDGKRIEKIGAAIRLARKPKRKDHG